MNQPTNTSCRTARPVRPFAVLVPAMLLILAAILTTSGPAQAHPRPSPDPGSCARRDLTVTLTPGRAAPRYRIAGWLCTPRHSTRTVQLAVSGFTYSHAYWTGTGTATSWTAAALAGGDAVYLIDRPGVGASDRPPADQVTAHSEAGVVHQIVAALRDGRLGRFAHVVGVGHSYGSIVLAAEAAAHRDLDALVLTGKLADYNEPGLTAFHNSLYPASADPKFAHARIPAGYVTTLPGTRAGFFLDPVTAVPGAAAWEEATKDVGTSGELNSMNVDAYVADSRQIKVPVLLMVGSNDSLFCNTTVRCDTGAQLCQRTRDLYAPATPVDAVTVPGAGHAIDLHRNAVTAFAQASQWITRTLASTGPRPAVTTCRS